MVADNKLLKLTVYIVIDVQMKTQLMTCRVSQLLQWYQIITLWNVSVRESLCTTISSSHRCRCLLVPCSVERSSGLLNKRDVYVSLQTQLLRYGWCHLLSISLSRERLMAHGTRNLHLEKRQDALHCYLRHYQMQSVVVCSDIISQFQYYCCI